MQIDTSLYIELIFYLTRAEDTEVLIVEAVAPANAKVVAVQQ